MEEIKVLIAKPGLDGHDRGALFLVRALRSYGMMVYYTGIRKTPREIAEEAIARQVDVIGLSCLSGAHNTLFPEVIKQLQLYKNTAIPVIGGGVIPTKDIHFLQQQGIKRIFTSESSSSEIAAYIRELVQKHQTAMS
ncbi:cobalamin-dependent protein [Radiobacillus sp. PE A8.2]|uniref:cobalamin-dependent protein n=1 Tax=Radiobacillus sp. PE A8.2 TaxID=3380349 RepID=UPI00388ED883